MSIVDRVHSAQDAEPKPGSPEDPFRLGWRYVTRRLPDGRIESEQVPLTHEDLLFPEEGDFAVQYWSHIEDCIYLNLTLRTKLAGDPRALVMTDCRVRWDVAGLRPLGPDIAVFRDAPANWDGGTLEVALTGSRPVLVVEITSPDTRPKDFGAKKVFYHQAGVPYYLIVDARPHPTKPRRVSLLGFRHTPAGYEPIPLDDQGRIWVESLDLWFAIRDRRAICIDGQTGQVIDHPVDQALARKVADARAATADARAETAAARADAAEAMAMTESDARRDAEARVQAETVARLAMEAQIAAMQAEIRRLRGED